MAKRELASEESTASCALIDTSSKELTAQAAWESFNEDEKEIFEQVNAALSNMVDGVIIKTWKFGTDLAKILIKAKKDDKKLEHGFMTRLSAAFGYPVSGGGGPLRTALRMVDAYPTKEILTQYMLLRGPEDFRLSYTHMLNLASVSDPEQRLSFAGMALANGWTAEDLAHEITSKKREDGGVPGSSTGRPPKVPANIHRCLEQMDGQFGRVSHYCETIWLGESYNVEAAIHELAPAEKNKRLLLELDTAVENAMKLSNQLTILIQKLSKEKDELELQIAAEEAVAASAKTEEPLVIDVPSVAVEEEVEELEPIEDDKPEPEETESEDEYIDMAEYMRKQHAPKRGRPKKAAV